MGRALVDPPAVHSENSLDLVRRLLLLRNVAVCSRCDGRVEDFTVNLVARQLEVRNLNFLMIIDVRAIMAALLAQRFDFGGLVADLNHVLRVAHLLR